MGELKKVFVTIKTYPTLSKKYDELVCTAGFLEDGSWVRIYPLPFRKLDYEQRYKKYQWLEAPLTKNTADSRPESCKVTDISRLRPLNVVDPGDDWEMRKQIIFNKAPVFTDLTELIKRAKTNKLSLAIFKPNKIINLVIEDDERDWPSDKLACLRAKAAQLSLFQTPEEVQREFSCVNKLPYKFSYRFTDDKGRESTMMIEDWEIGMLYWNCLNSSNGNEALAIQKVKIKYFDEFLNKDIYLFLGTTQQFHNLAPNPFIIIGVFYPPLQNQQAFNFNG